MDTINLLFKEVDKKIQDSTLISIQKDKQKQDRFINITKEVADICMNQVPKPSMEEYHRRVVDQAYFEFIKDIQGGPAPFPGVEPPFKEPISIKEQQQMNIPHYQMKHDKNMNINVGTRPSQAKTGEKRTIIIDTGQGPTRANITSSDATENDLINFSVNLISPLILDSIYEVYLESMTASGTVAGAHDGTSTQEVQTNEQYFNIKISELQIPSFSNNSNLSSSLLIPNDKGSNGIIAGGTKDNHVFKSKKFNYITTVNPETINTLTFKVTLADGSTSIFYTNSGDAGNRNRIIFEFVFIPLILKK